MKLRDVFVLGLATTLAAACNNSEDAVGEDAAQPEPVLTPAPQATAAPDGTAVMPGTWSVNESAEGARAVFAGEDAEPTLTIACERLSGTVTLDIASAAQTPEAWRLDAGGEAARIDMTPVPGGLSAEIEPTLAIFHAFAAEGDVVVLTAPTGERMQFPTRPGINRVLEACM